MSSVDLTGALVSLDEAVEHLNSDTVDFDELGRFIQAATEAINRRCGYTAPTPFTETVNFSASGGRNRVSDVVLSRTPVLSVSAITPTVLGIPTYDLTRLVVDSESGVIYFSNWWSFYGPATVSYIAGRVTVPPTLQTACLLMVKNLWESQRGAGPMPGPSQAEQWTPNMGMFPPEVTALLDIYPFAPGIA